MNKQHKNELTINQHTQKAQQSLGKGDPTRVSEGQQMIFVT